VLVQTTCKNFWEHAKNFHVVALGVQNNTGWWVKKTSFVIVGGRTGSKDVYCLKEHFSFLELVLSASTSSSPAMHHG
jgi:hypothetical protein